MTLANLLAIQRLQAFKASPAAIQRLLGAAARNLNDYEGDPVSDAVVAECLTQAEQLLAHTRQCLQSQRPDLLVAPKVTGKN